MKLNPITAGVSVWRYNDSMGAQLGPFDFENDPGLTDVLFKDKIMLQKYLKKEKWEKTGYISLFFIFPYSFEPRLYVIII